MKKIEHHLIYLEGQTNRATSSKSKMKENLVLVPSYPSLQKGMMLKGVGLIQSRQT